MSYIGRAKSVLGARKYITHHTFYKGVSYSKQLTEIKANITRQDAIRPAWDLARNSKIDYFCLIQSSKVIEPSKL